MSRARRLFLVWAVLVLAMPASVGAARGDAPTIQITEPSGSTTIGEGYDFATSAWGDPWDMASTGDVFYWGNPVCGNPSTPWTAVGVTGGVWHGQATVLLPALFLLQPGYADGALIEGRDGLYQPIDAGRYYRLTFRMKLSSASGNSQAGYILYSDGSFENQTDPAHWSRSQLIKTYADDQWHIYSIDLRTVTPGSGSLAWTSGKWMTALAIVPGIVAGVTMSLDWARLSDDFVGHRVSWTGSYQNTATVQLGLGNTTDGFVPLHVYEPGEWQGTYYNPTAIYALDGSYLIYGGLGQSSYTVRATVTDGTGSTTSAAAGPWAVRGASWGSFTKPGFTAGTDWVTQLSGDPWDMDVPNSADIIAHPVNVASWEYVNSGSSNLYHGVSVDTHQTCVPSGDPQLQMRMHQGTIDSSVYHWLTFRMWVEGVPDLASGSVARVSWWNDNFSQCGETNDFILRNGWNTYSLDLTGDVVEPSTVCPRTWLSGDWRHFRVDPHEVPSPTGFWIDYVILAADVKANANVELVWNEYVPSGSSATMALYYDSDRNPVSGRTLITTGGLERAMPKTLSGDAPGCTLSFCWFLPLVRGGITPSMCTNGVCRYTWNTSQLPEGSYYVYVESFDGYSTIGRYSDTPVVVDH